MCTCCLFTLWGLDLCWYLTIGIKMTFSLQTFVSDVFALYHVIFPQDVISHINVRVTRRLICAANICMFTFYAIFTTLQCLVNCHSPVTIVTPITICSNHMFGPESNWLTHNKEDVEGFVFGLSRACRHQLSKESKKSKEGQANQRTCVFGPVPSETNALQCAHAERHAGARLVDVRRIWKEHFSKSRCRFMFSF